MLAGILVYVDLYTWIELNVAIVYSLPLVLAALARSRWLIWALALVLLAATFCIYIVQLPAVVFTPHEPIFVDRVLASVTLLLSAALLHALTVAVDELDARSRNAEAASDRKSRLLASVSHDLRTPLTTINLMADLIRHTAADPSLAARVPEIARSLQANALSMADMVSDVLDISAIDAGSVTVHESEFSAGDLLVQECATMQPLARAKSLRLECEPVDPPIVVRADRVKLGRVVRNLLSNAIKFTERGAVTASAALGPDGTVQIRVADTGMGIAPENLNLIFGEFAQLRAATGEEKRGWGLGLAISRRLVALMGGRMTVESVLNRGSVFTVHLPAISRIGEDCSRPA